VVTVFARNLSNRQKSLPNQTFSGISMVQMVVRKIDAQERDTFICTDELDTTMTERNPNTASRSILAISCLAAALALTACGGEGGGEGSRLDSTVPFSERGSNSNTGTSTDDSASNSGGASSEDTGTAESPTAGTGNVESPAADAESETAESSASDEDAAGNDTETVDGSGSAAAASSKLVLRWSVPSHRVNGEHLNRDDVGGYEIRYRESPESDFTYISVADGGEREFVLDEDLSDNYEFQIATYDVDGLYSSFVSLVPHEEES